jgi:hypothetical protein
LVGLAAQHGRAALALKKWEPDPAFKFGEPLGKCRSSDSKVLGGGGSGGVIGGGHQVLKLLHTEVR